jgi:hypothetical protein
MSSIGHIKLFSYDMGLLSPVLLVLLAPVLMWLGYRFSRRSDNQISIRRPKTPRNSAIPAARTCPGGRE